ncbi:TPA: hypothetical protein ACGPBH_001149 [Streptococcus suis]|nr:hypothetical protein [Streptococcus suis]
MDSIIIHFRASARNSLTSIEAALGNKLLATIDLSLASLFVASLGDIK